MAVRSVSMIFQVHDDGYSDGSLWVTLHGVVIGTNIGDLPAVQYETVVGPFDPDSVTLKSDIQASLKSWLISQNVPFGVLNIDSVKIVP